MRGTVAHISLAALTHNVDQIVRLAPRSGIVAMLKANAYGHGLIEMAKALKQVQAFGVATMDEALLLRHSGIKQPIWLMQGLSACRDLVLLQKHQITVVLSSVWEVQYLSRLKKAESPLTVWLKFDIGMHRLGLTGPDQAQAVQQIRRQNHILFKGIIGHFSHADCDETMTNDQFQLFSKCTAPYAVEKSLANSSAIMSMPQTALQWVRPGIMLYGSHSMTSPPATPLKPVMTLKAAVIAIHTLNSGQGVGYASTWHAPVDGTKVAVVAIGYGDGYPRAAGNKASVLIRQQKAPVVGTVSMDLIMIEVTHIPQVMLGDLVTLWGEGLPVEEVAKECGTIANACLTGLTTRVPRIYMTQAAQKVPVSA